MNNSSIHRSARAGILAVVVSILVGLLSVVAPPSASAAIFQAVSGRTGGVTLNGPLVTGRDVLYYNGYAGSYYTRTFSTAGVTVSRSGAYAGTQRVMGGYVLQRYVNGAWQNVQSTSYWSGTVSGTGRITFPAYSFANPPQYTSRFPYRIAVVLAWTRADNGAVVGSARVVSSLASDNQCATRWIACRVYTDSIVM